MLDGISDRDFLNDSESNDEFDRKFEDSIQAHRESSRPSSSSSRPKTASRYREESESRINMISNNTYQIYLRLSKFLSYRKISKTELAMKLGDYFTAEKLKQVLEDFGFELSEGEANFIFRDSGIPKNGVLSLTLFSSKVIEEEEMDSDDENLNFKENELTKTLLKEAEELLARPRSKSKKQGKGVKDRKMSARSSNRSEKSDKSDKSEKLSLRSISRSSAHRPPSNFSLLKLTLSRNYLKETKMKTHQEKVELENTADLYRRQYEFDCIQKMGEANEILLNFGSEISYRCLRKDDKTLMCHVYKKEKFEEEISLHNFLRKWKKLKERKPKSVKVPASQTTSKSISTNNAKVNKTERQEEVKKLLLETRELTNSLKTQVKMLEEKGIVKRVIEKDNLVLINSRM